MRRHLPLLAAVLLGWQASLFAEDADWRSLLEEAQTLRGTQPAAALERLDRELGQADPEPAAGEDLHSLAELYRLRGELLRSQGDYARAAADAERFAALTALTGEVELTARALFLRGTIEAEQGQFARALEHFHAARQMLETEEHPAELARIFNAIGVTHNFAGDRIRAQTYIEQALAAARETGNPRLVATFLANLAMMVADNQGPAEALPLHREALSMGEELNDLGIRAQALANLCDLLVNIRELDEAEAVCPEAFEKVETIGETRLRAGIRMARGNLEVARDQPEAALALYEEGLDIARGVVPVVHLELLHKLADLHEQLDQPAAALESYRELLTRRDEDLERERQALMEELEVRYQLERSAAELDMLRLRSELQSTQIRLRNALVLGLAIVLALAVIAAFGAMRANRIRAGLQKDLAAQNRELEGALERISELARTDSLTGLLNRRALDELGSQELARSRREGWPVSVLITDIDHFKPVNDRHGHSIGDELLSALAKRLRKTFRETDLVARWGGEEFLCVLPNTSTEAAAAAVARLRDDLKSQPIRTRVGPIPVTLTWGIAPLGDSLAETIRRADKALYEGKRSGRDTVVISEAEMDGET